jgi:hypothetical protein
MKTGFIFLRVDKGLHKKARGYAKGNHTTLSKLIKDYLTEITKSKEEITPLVKSLSGIIKPGKISGFKKEYADYLTGKYQ